MSVRTFLPRALQLLLHYRLRITSFDIFTTPCFGFPAVSLTYLLFTISCASFSQFAVGAVIVNPQTNHPIALSHDLRCTGHPLQHAVMVCIDLVAHGQHAGAWELNCQATDGTWALKEPNKQQIEQNLNSVDCNTCLHEHNTSVSRSSSRDPYKFTNILEEKKESLPYLCTGYDLYTTREPCVM